MVGVVVRLHSQDLCINARPASQGVLKVLHHQDSGPMRWNEALASYVLEGFLEEALSDSRSGKAFRATYVLYAVPIVDVDGVAEGDHQLLERLAVAAADKGGRF